MEGAKQFITQIVTDTLNARFFIVGDYYDVTYVNTERYLTVCIESNSTAVKLLITEYIGAGPKSDKAPYKGRLIILDNKNLEEFASIRTYNALVEKLPSGAEGLGIILQPKE